MKIEKLNDNCFKIILEEDCFIGMTYKMDLHNCVSDLYLKLEESGVKLDACRLVGYFMNKDLLFKALQLKNNCAEPLIPSKYLFFADLQDNEVIVKFEPTKIYSLEEILK